MRTVTISTNGVADLDFTVKCVDELAFAFNPCIVVVEHTGLDWAEVIIGAGSKTFKVQCVGYNGKAFFDLREYIQALFDEEDFGDIDYSEDARRTELGKMVTFGFAASWNGGNTVINYAGTEIQTFFIWGALKVGGEEVYNAKRTLKWFRGYPFTVGVYAHGGGSILFARDGVPSKFINLNEQGVWNVLIDDAQAEKYITLSDCTGALVETTFDSTFDLTFRMSGGGTITEKIRVEIVDGIDDGVYLRWINRHGFYCYWLFKRGAEQRKTSIAQEFFRNNLEAYDMSYGYQYGAGRRQMYQREDTIPVCAPLVDSVTWDWLFDCATSPVVEMLAGYDEQGAPRWMSVGVQAGTYTKAEQVLQDFVINVLLPEVPIQIQ